MTIMKRIWHLFQKVHTYIVTLTIYKSKTKEFLLKIHKPFKLYIPEGDLHYYQLNIHSSIYGEENLKKIIAINKENKA